MFANGKHWVQGICATLLVPALRRGDAMIRRGSSLASCPASEPMVISSTVTRSDRTDVCTGFREAGASASQCVPAREHGDEGGVR